ncbi:MAG: hypothetical protein ACI4MI_00385 [Christensenellales bacterium]
MKNKIKIALLLIIMVICFCMTACQDELPQILVSGSYEGVDYTALTKVKNMSAFELYQQVYETYKNDTGYYRNELFHFKTTAAEQSSHFVVYRDGDKFLSREVTVGEGVGPAKANNLKTLYFDGTNYYSNSYLNNKKIVPGKSSDKGTMDYFKVNNYGTLTLADDIDACIAKKLDDTSHLTTYVMNDKSLLSQFHNDNVYVDDNGVYYFTIALDCSNETINGKQIAAKEEFVDRTGCNSDSFEMNMDTTIDFTVEKIDGVMKITSWLRHEKYQGKAYGLLLKCEQTCKTELVYDQSQFTIDQSVIKSQIDVG